MRIPAVPAGYNAEETAPPRPALAMPIRRPQCVVAYFDDREIAAFFRRDVSELDDYLRTRTSPTTYLLSRPLMPYESS